jgi:hypothetical protein
MKGQKNRNLESISAKVVIFLLLNVSLPPTSGPPCYPSTPCTTGKRRVYRVPLPLYSVGRWVGGAWQADSSCSFSSMSPLSKSPTRSPSTAVAASNSLLLCLFFVGRCLSSLRPWPPSHSSSSSAGRGQRFAGHKADHKGSLWLSDHGTIEPHG